MDNRPATKTEILFCLLLLAVFIAICLGIKLGWYYIVAKVVKAAGF